MGWGLSVTPTNLLGSDRMMFDFKEALQLARELLSAIKELTEELRRHRATQAK